MKNVNCCWNTKITFFLDTSGACTIKLLRKAGAYPFRCSTFRQAPGLNHKHQTRLERLARDKTLQLITKIHKLLPYNVLQYRPLVFKVIIIDIERRKNRLLKFCYVPATSSAYNRLLFFLFLLRPFTVLMKQTRQAVHAIKQSIFLDVYGYHLYLNLVYLSSTSVNQTSVAAQDNCFSAMVSNMFAVLIFEKMVIFPMKLNMKMDL